MQLANYQTEVRMLIRDRSGILVPTDELNLYINEARRDVCRITGCLRAHIAGNAPFGNGATPGLMVPGGIILGNADTTITTFTTLSGVESYHFGYAKRWLQAQYQGYDSVIDLIEVAVSWGSAARPVMEWESWEVLQALARIYSAGVFTYPFKSALQGDGINQRLFLFPVPSQALEMEWDAICTPKALYSNSDYEAIPEPFDAAVKYRAASRAYESMQRFGSAETMMAEFTTHLGIDRAAVERDRVPSYYDMV